MDFWLFCAERERVRIRRESRLPREEWTQDKVLATCRFTNIDRRHDYGTRLLLDAATWCDDVELLTHLALCYRYLGSPVWLPPALGPMNVISERAMKIAKRRDRGEVVMNTRAYQAIVPYGMSMIDFVIDHGEEMNQVLLDACPRSCGGPARPLDVVDALAGKSRSFGYHSAWFQAMETVKDVMMLLPERIDPQGEVRLGPGAVTGLMEHLGYMPRRCDAMLLTKKMVVEGAEKVPEINWSHDVVEHALCEFGKYCRSVRGERKGGTWEPTHQL